MTGKEVSSKDSPETIESSFHRIVKCINETPEGPDASTSWTVKLRMYGLYKHITVGPLPYGVQPPPVYRLDARAKYEAHAACRSLSRVEFMKEYVEIVAAEPSRADAVWTKSEALPRGNRKKSFPDLSEHP
jgi:acyl-CoA-binding protein